MAVLLSALLLFVLIINPFISQKPSGVGVTIHAENAKCVLNLWCWKLIIFRFAADVSLGRNGW